jgi:hypothetical protein
MGQFHTTPFGIGSAKIRFTGFSPKWFLKAFYPLIS